MLKYLLVNYNKITTAITIRNNSHLFLKLI